MRTPIIASDIRTRRLYVDYANGYCREWPVRWPDGTIAYDWPERVPAKAKRLVERAFIAQGQNA